jgi:outer membrane protein assembly factor BamB
MSSRKLGRALAASAAIVALGAGLSACSGFGKVPSIPFMGKKDDKKHQVTAKGERIPVLALNQKLEPSAALSGVGFQIPAAQDQADWPVPGGNAEHAIEHVSAGKELKIAWREHIGRGDSATSEITSPPVVAEGKVFALDGRAQVAALDALTGHPAWKTDLAPRKGLDREAYGGGVAYGDGQVFVASGYRFVAALDAKTGRQLWRTEMNSPVHGAPNVADGKLYVVDTEDQLHTLDVKTGQELWSYQALEEPARMEVASSPAVSGDTVIAPFASGELTALKSANGNDLWSFVLSLTNRNSALSEIRDIAGRPVIYRGDAFAGSHSGVFAAVDLRTGQPKWSQPIATISAPWPAGDVIYVTDQAGTVVCLDRGSGQVYWMDELNKNLRKKFRANWSGPILASDRLIIVSDKGELLALDPHTGQKQTSLRLGAPAFLTPVAAGGLLYVLANNGDLVAIR